MKHKRKHHHLQMILLFLYLFFYTLISSSFITAFPFVHSDEAWLAGLTRDMQAGGSFGVTESFFAVKPRVAHGIKLLYHGLQMVYIQLFGYRIESVRLLSLSAGLICLLLLYRIGKKLGGSWSGIGLMIMVSLDIAFIYASHFARQEILLCIFLLAILLILLKCNGQPGTRQILLLAAITGLSVGIHPNSFLGATLCGLVLLICGCFPDKDSSIRCHVRGLLLYTAATGTIAAIFIGISFLFSPRFFPDYFRYGEQEFALSHTASGRLTEFHYYLKSIYTQESGTYYVPNQRLSFIFISIALVLVLLAGLFLSNSDDDEAKIWCAHTRVILAAIIGVILGMLIIGRYNQTSVILLLMPCWLALIQLALLFEKHGRLLAVSLMTVLLAGNSFLQIQPWLNVPAYNSYLAQLEEFIPRDAITIANLNTGFYFDQGKLLDYRDLPYLADFKELEHYIEYNNVQYICLTDELDYIYENRPYYNVIYGNGTFIPHLKLYCETNGTLVGSFEAPWYSPRIIDLIGSAEYATVTVYRLVSDTPAIDS